MLWAQFMGSNHGQAPSIERLQQPNLVQCYSECADHLQLLPAATGSAPVSQGQLSRSLTLFYSMSYRDFLDGPAGPHAFFSIVPRFACDGDHDKCASIMI